MASEADDFGSSKAGGGSGLAERLEKISLGLRRLRTGEERPEAVEYRDFGNGHFAVAPKGRFEKNTTD